MLNIGQCYKIIGEDFDSGSGTVVYHPEFKKGAEFKVVKIEERRWVTGITAVQFRDGPLIDIAEFPNSPFWAFYVDNEMAHLIEQFEEISSDPIEVINRINMYAGRPIALALDKMASQENCDTEEYDLMVKAAAYIRWLEKELDCPSF
ncbi:hypothetical protein BN80_079 [Yersinia phage phiR1-RT]|uniref:Protease inhibitor n=1 Tax=Yersinia phage phiR1-RT TaxID=1206558 RepID=I7J3W9_BPPR1|nr:inhibitor of host Lon protease [Yersinia phage phiR1-RT]CCI88653.1 hypothetical protein BN80_079 [Yersinia phage phiR1-RT]